MDELDFFQLRARSKSSNYEETMIVKYCLALVPKPK